MGKSILKQPWWLGEEGEICPGCSQTYAYGTEYRCVACDVPVCAMCVQISTASLFYCETCVVEVEFEGTHHGH